MNPPPLGRRISMLTAVVSVIMSVAVAAVAIPKGIEEYSDDQEPATTSTLLTTVKGSVGSSMTTLTSGGTASSAISLGPGLWLASADALGPSQEVSLSSAGSGSLSASVISNIGDTGTALVRTRAAQGRAIDISAIVPPDTLGDLTRYVIYDPVSERMSSIAPSISLSSTTDDVPISTSEPIRGIASVIDDKGKVVGIVVRRGHSTWLLGRTSIEQLKKSIKRR